MRLAIHGSTAAATRAPLRRITRFGMLALLVAGVPPTVRAQGFSQQDELAVIVGRWFGADFLQRTTFANDPFEGSVEFGSALAQGDAMLIGIQYSLYLRSWLATEVSAAYMSNEWTTTAGRITGGTLSGTSTIVSGVITIPVSVNLRARLPLMGRGPSPFVSVGAGAVFYEIGRSRAPLVITTSGGIPLDTLLFDLDLGARFAPNVAAGVQYQVTNKIGMRLEGRLWFTVLHDRISNERPVQKNGWLAISAGRRF